MNISKEINKKILEVWKEKYGKNSDVYVPLFYPELKNNCIVFIGFNPSFSEKDAVRILKKHGYKDINQENVNDFYKFKLLNEEKIKEFVKIHTIMKNEYSYFDRFREISESVNLDWVHLDLFFIRKTNQKEV